MLKEAINISLTNICVTTDKETQRETLIILFQLEDLLLEVPSCLFLAEQCYPWTQCYSFVQFIHGQSKSIIVGKGRRKCCSEELPQEWTEPSMNIFQNTSSQIYSSSHGTCLCPSLQQPVKLLKWKLFEDAHAQQASKYLPG